MFFVGLNFPFFHSMNDSSNYSVMAINEIFRQSKAKYVKNSAILLSKKNPHFWETQGVGTKDVGNFVNVHSIAVLGAIFAILEARSNILDNCNTQK